MNKIVDIVIVGAGIAGLTSAYEISKINSRLSCIILEKEAELGGRIHYDHDFGLGEENDLKMGGGFLRETDIETIHLLDELHVPYYTKVHRIQFMEESIDILQLLEETRKIYKMNPPHPGTSFRTYAISIWGYDLYQLFLQSNMYDDFQNSSAHEILFDSDFTYNTDGYIEGIVQWDHVIQALQYHIPYPIYTNCTVTSVKKLDSIYKIHTSHGNFYSRKIILTIPALGLQHLLPNRGYQYLIPSPSIKIYAKVTPKTASLLKTHVKIHTIVTSPLHNIMPIHPEKRIYLIAYADEEKATFLNNYVDDTIKNRNYLARMMETSLHVPKGSISFEHIHGKYWSSAMHINHTSISSFSSISSFLHKLQHPEPMIRVVGEVVGDHGWIGGAVDTVMKNIVPTWVNM